MEKDLVIQVAGIMIGGLGTIFLALLTWGVKSLISSVNLANKELHLIQYQIKTLVDDTKAIPEMRKDIDGIGNKVRSLENKS